VTPEQAVPPPELIARVSGNTDLDAYRQVGCRSARRVLEAAGDHPVRDVLDWGCGPGRVAVHLARAGGLALHGCDPDPEAVAWCREHIPAGQFAVSGLYPPLPYPGGSFDLVIGVSVMTHLTRRVQRKWLRELSRVLRPGGLLVATVHGQAAAGGFGVTDLAGIRDHYADPFMAGVLPAGYYRTVLQDEAYTRRAWSDWFDVISYEEAALELHDLVVCRNRGG
jgi:SAM-dependent methyltransferase